MVKYTQKRLVRLILKRYPPEKRLFLWQTLFGYVHIVRKCFKAIFIRNKNIFKNLKKSDIQNIIIMIT